MANTLELNNGKTIPQLGYGTFRVPEGDDLAAAVKTAIQEGYRLIDTAAIYNNEASVGQGIREAINDGLVTREELFITSKVWNDGISYEETLQAYDDALARMQLDYLDLYLLHWPGTNNDFIPQWQALETLYKDKRVKSIGVSNFHVHHLDKLLAETTIVPAVNQIELNPLQTQQKVRAYCLEKGIQIEAWSPLMNAAVLDNATLKTIASKYNKTTAQIILRWQIQTNIVTIPKSMTPSRIAENAQIFDFELDGEDILLIENLNENGHYGPDPESFDFGR